MKITAVKTYLLEKELSSSMTISRGGFNKRFHAVVKVETDEGLVGYGEGIGNAQAVVALLKAVVIPKVIGLDPTDINGLREKTIDDHVYFEQKGSMICAASAIEMACWDIKAKSLDTPLANLLGGTTAGPIKLYASDVYWEEDIKKMAERCEIIQSKGIRAVKAHIGYKGPEEELERVRVIRESIGATDEMMIDLNCGYNYEQAIKAVDLWGPYNIAWLEEPFTPYEVKHYADLKARTDIPIAAGENEFLVHGFKNLLEADAVDYLMPDLGRVGGLQECLDVCALAKSFDKKVTIHNYSSGVLLAFSAAFTAANPSCFYLEYDCSENAFYQELFEEPLKVEDGHLHLTDKPGIGVQIKDDILSPYEV